jgi:hypothetical protein
MSAPRQIPEDLRSDFTLKGKIPVYDYYFNDLVPENTISWHNTYLKSFIDRFSLYNIRHGLHGEEPYGGAAQLHLIAFEKYIDSIKNKKVAVIGSQTPWIEAILVNCGAKEVTVVEYNVPICNNEIIKAISYTDFCKSSEKYDVIVSYSSIEHSGLGRYGDPLNPNGDIETMQEIYKSLKTGGLCFVGFPVGTDCLVWNAHRIYGKIRLKLLFLDKFKELDWVGCDKNYINTIPTATGAIYPIPSGSPDFIQPIIILEKPHN